MVGAREGPLEVAEEFTLDELLGQSRAVDRDEGTIAAVSRGVDIPRRKFLASAGFAGNQDCQIPGFSGRRRDETDDGLVCAQGFASPVEGDERKEALLIKQSVGDIGGYQ